MYIELVNFIKRWEIREYAEGRATTDAIILNSHMPPEEYKKFCQMRSSFNSTVSEILSHGDVSGVKMARADNNLVEMFKFAMSTITNQAPKAYNEAVFRVATDMLAKAYQAHKSLTKPTPTLYE